jgi:hypothetical protein
MSTPEDQRDGRAEESASEAPSERGGDEESPLRAAVKVAAAGALVGAAAAAARAAATHRGDSDGDERGSTGSADNDREAQADEETESAVEDVSARADAGTPKGKRHADEPREESEEKDEEELRRDRPEGSSLTTDDGPLARIIGTAARQLSDLAGHPAEGVRAFKKSEDGWLVEVELVELARIPSTTDVLGVYEVEVDDEGRVREYRRTRRYVRSQADDSRET